VGKNNLTVGGLCSGVGGIEYGFKKAGYEILWANDMDKYAMQTYQSLHKKNHFIGKKPYTINQILQDRNLQIELKKVDVLVSGFPCQPFSIAGNRKGLDDHRSTVIEQIFEVVKLLNRPKVLFLENVKNFRNHNGGETFNKISKIIKKELKYSVYDIILNSSLYTNIPQNRERTYMICFKDEPSWELPDLFDDFSEKAPMTSFFHNNLPQKKFINYSKEKFVYDEINEKDIYSKDHYPKYYKMLESVYSETDKDTFYQIRRIYARKNSKGLCPTLTANMGTGGHNVPIIRQEIGKQCFWRRLTPKECFNLQGFPKTFRIPSQIPKGQLYKQAGNSVTVPLIVLLAKSIKLAITNR